METVFRLGRETRYGAIRRHDRLQGPGAMALVLGGEYRHLFRNSPRQN